MTLETIGWLLLAVTITGVVWLADSWWRPHNRCRWCGGTGRGRFSTSRAYNYCWRCKNEPERVRIGARAISKATGRPVRGTRKEK